MADHQINEHKKRIDEIDALSQTYKNQLAQQKQMEAQQNQINTNEVQKLNNHIEYTESQHN